MTTAPFSKRHRSSYLWRNVLPHVRGQAAVGRSSCEAGATLGPAGELGEA